jgi:NADPH:quinone reductase-like Zn-dependent oxidoreductase
MIPLAGRDQCVQAADQCNTVPARPSVESVTRGTRWWKPLTRARVEARTRESPPMPRVRLKPLSRQTVVVTGATSGIGLATVRMAA